MQLPVIKDGVVVNVVEIDAGTLCVDKAVHANLTASEDADYAAQYQAWQAEIAKRRNAIATAKTSHFMANGSAAVIAAQARAHKGDAADMLDRVLIANAEVEAWAAKVADMEAQPLPEKPRMKRAPRCVYPEGHVVGPAGGNIGDSWDGKAYTAPAEKAV